MGTEDGRILMQLGGATRACVERDKLMQLHCSFTGQGDGRSAPGPRTYNRYIRATDDDVVLMGCPYFVERYVR